MKVISRMRTPMAGRTCLFLFLCLLSGCWDSHPKQVASDQPAGQVGGATASSDQPSGKAEESSSTKKSVATSLDDEFGFKRTWKPGATPPAKSSTATSRNPASGDPILPKHAQSAETSATAGSNPALGNVILPGSKPLVKSSAAAPDVVAHGATEDDRYAELAPAPAVGSPVEAAQTPAYHSTGDTPPAGNPLRDPGAAAATGR